MTKPKGKVSLNGIIKLRGHGASDAQSRAASNGAGPDGHRPADTHGSGAVGSSSVYDDTLMLAADFFDDIERVRIANENRLRSLEQVKGQVNSDEYADMEDMFNLVVILEQRLEKRLRRMMQGHPLAPWVQSSTGVGDKQGARMIAAIGDPLTKAAVIGEDDEVIEPERPRRGPAELWQYAGHGDPERSRRRRGEQLQYNPKAKMRVHLVAMSCIKSRCTACREASTTVAWTPPPESCTCPDSHPYRAVYDDARMAWMDRDTSDGHKQNHALRLVGKAILKDLYNFAKEHN
jgi:hypothetical protein